MRDFLRRQKHSEVVVLLISLSVRVSVSLNGEYQEFPIPSVFSLYLMNKNSVLKETLFSIQPILSPLENFSVSQTGKNSGSFCEGVFCEGTSFRTVKQSTKTSSAQAPNFSQAL